MREAERSGLPLLQTPQGTVVTPTTISPCRNTCGTSLQQRESTRAPVSDGSLRSCTQIHLAHSFTHSFIHSRKF